MPPAASLPTSSVARPHARHPFRVPRHSAGYVAPSSGTIARPMLARRSNTRARYLRRVNVALGQRDRSEEVLTSLDGTGDRVLSLASYRAMARLSLKILGGFELRAESRSVRLPAKKAQALLAYLAMR